MPYDVTEFAKIIPLWRYFTVRLFISFQSVTGLLKISTVRYVGMLNREGIL